ncbi:hypothetical protein BsWGS_20893 [Bradybaena similaris]
MERHRIRRKHGNTHISLTDIKQYLLHGTYPIGLTPSDKRSVRKRSESFKILDGELYYIVRPKRVEGEPVDTNPGENKANLRQAILTQKAQFALTSAVHVQNGGNHMGTERTLSSLSSKYYWVGMANTVRKVAKNCVVCLANRPAVATLPSASHPVTFITQGAEFAATLPASQEFISEKKDVYTESHLASKSDDEPADMQYIVTAEIAEPEEVDADLDFVKVIQTENGSLIDPVFHDRSDFDAARKFWQKVEILVLGSFPWKKKKTAYVVIAMDSFSKWPEVHTVCRVNEKTVSQFCLRLIARYGVMEQLILLENEASAEESLSPTGVCQNLQAYSVVVSKESYNVVDENWNFLLANILRFIKVYKDNWLECLDLCLIPLRNSLTRATDFTPSYVLLGREPVFPECIIQGKDSTDAEVALSQEQIEQSVDVAMSHYLQCSVPDIKQIILPEGAMDSVYEIPPATSPVRKSGRKTKKYHRLAGFDNPGGKGSPDVDKPSENTANDYLTSKRRKQGGSSLPHRKSLDAVTKQEVKNEFADNCDYLNKSQEHNYDVLEKLDLDTYYQTVYRYKREGSYPANSDSVFKDSVQKECENFTLENGQLMYRLQGMLKRVPTTLQERLTLMKDAHITKDGHMTRNKTTEAVESQNIFWRDMHLDIQAFVVACCACRHREPRRRSRTSKRTSLRWYRGAEDDGDSDEETNVDIGKVSYEELVDYLRKDIIPDGLTRSELLVFRKKAKNFRLIKGGLYFCPAKKQNTKPRKVLKTENERQDALKEAHGDQHAGHAGMEDVLKKQFFWQTLTEDIGRFLVACCQQKPPTDDSADEDVDKHNPLLEARIKVFQDYFAGKKICHKQEVLDSLFPVKADVSEEVTGPLRDLVAAAMESAKLITCSMSPQADCTQENSNQMEVSASLSSASRETINSVASDQAFNSQSVLEVIPMNRQTETDKIQSRLVHSSQDVICKKSNSDNDDVNNEDIDEEDVIERMEDDRDMTWNPSSTKGMKLPAKQLSKSPKKKSSVRRRCEYCQEVIRGDNNFKEHMYKHTRVKPFHCNTCEKKFTSFKGLKMHARKHTGHRPYLCNICGRGFPRSASLHYHIKTHDKGGGVPVVCDVCSRVFSTENRMQKHKRFKHPLQAPVHMCNVCGKVFTAKRSLKRHEEAHRGVRRYECQYCKRSFFRKEYLNYHLFSHSNIDPALANFKLKGKLRKAGGIKKREYPTTGLSIVCLEASDVPSSQSQEMYEELVEVTVPRDWTEVTQGERTMVYEINSEQRAGDGTLQHVTEDGTTVVVMEEYHDAQSGDLEVRHIILPSDHLPQHAKQAKQITIHHQPHMQHHRELGQPQSFEVTLPTGTHTFTLPGVGPLHSADTDHGTVQYQVECPGDTLTEDDFNAIRVLAQASLSGSHLIQQ